MPREPDWRTSTRSVEGDCVEVALTGDSVLVRDSKDRSGPVLTFDNDRWREFLRFVTTEL